MHINEHGSQSVREYLWKLLCDLFCLSVALFFMFCGVFFVGTYSIHIMSYQT